MDIRQIKYFLSVAEARSFTRAAERIRIAQPALSRQIRRLEEELDSPLLIRHGRGVYLTESGKLLRTRAEALIRQMERIRDEIQSQAEEPIGTVTLGVPPTLRPILIAPVLAKFHRQFRKAFLRVRVSTSEVLREAVTNGQLDMAIILSDEPAKSLKCEPLMRQQMVLVGNRANWPGFKDPVGPEDIAGLPLILTSLPNGLRVLVQDYLVAEGQTPNLVMEMNEITLMLDLVRQGLGYTFLPRCYFYDEVQRHRIALAPVKDLHIAWKIATAKERYEPAVAHKLKDLLLSEAKTASAAEIRLD